MSGTARILRVVSATVAVVGIGLLVWWFAIGQDARSESASEQQTPVPDASAAATATAPPTATAVPTATPTPTPTPVPTPLPFAEAAPLGPLGELLRTPLPDCGLLRDPQVVAGTVALTCIEDWSTVPVVASADGRIVDVVRSPAVDTGQNTVAGMWDWADQSQLGPHVVIDHGSLGETSNTQTVYAGLATIEDGIAVGATIAAGSPLGAIAGPAASLRYSIWINDTRQDGAQTLAAGPEADEQRAVAQALRPLIASPTDSACPLALNFGSLPGASRAYRNGTHRGIDFGCGAADRSAFAIADGTVVYMVNDYADPTVPEREALLQQAGIAGFTPHWTLVMLYGNVVVIDHGELPGVGRVVTISAHLEEVDSAIGIGSQVTKGQRLGELGNRGTNAAALGLRGAQDPSLHLHWELFIDNWYLGAGLDGPTTSEVIVTALCGAAATAGCPA